MRLIDAVGSLGGDASTHEGSEEYADIIWHGESIPEAELRAEVARLTIVAEIKMLEDSLTPRKLREATLNKGQGLQVVKDIDDQITVLRGQL